MRSAWAACLISPIGVVSEATRRRRASASDSSCAVSMSARRLRSSMFSNMRRSVPVVISGIGHSAFLGRGTFDGSGPRARVRAAWRLGRTGLQQIAEENADDIGAEGPPGCGGWSTAAGKCFSDTCQAVPRKCCVQSRGGPDR